MRYSLFLLFVWWHLNNSKSFLYQRCPRIFTTVRYFSPVFSAMPVVTSGSGLENAYIRSYRRIDEIHTYFLRRIINLSNLLNSSDCFTIYHSILIGLLHERRFQITWISFLVFLIMEIDILCMISLLIAKDCSTFRCHLCLDFVSFFPFL